jgi:diguanylate cyclase (GGDEF)-like protein
VRETKSLVAQVRTDPLTGLLSRGALQIDLDSLCAKATDEEPVTVLLFDLNGFKSYNDTCGHPAGDELLTELGGRLRATVGDESFAYRVGGDEFCVVLTSVDKSVDELTRKAAIALSTRKNGVDVSASWGSATIPADAEGPREAMQLADVRMYAQKESRRVSRGGERGPMAVPLEPPTPEPDLERRLTAHEPGSVEA